jgi:hypothetical protein
MEVHHHTQTPRKKWTHYFWEFFMLFLAVTLGFFVENQREHYIENKRAKRYALLLIQDLSKDTIVMQDRINTRRLYDLKRDSFLYYLNIGPEKNGRYLYYYGYFSLRYPVFVSNNATFQQLRNSGSLRFIENIFLYKSITEYYQNMEGLRIIDNVSEYSARAEELFSTVFNASEFQKIDPNNTRNDAVVPAYDPPLMTYDVSVINQLKHFVINYIKRSRGLLRGYENNKQHAAQLIADLKKEYHLE